jgi:O-antigen/teichoic acid export membrane protein
MGGWQMAAKLFAFFGTVWAVRCLGPEKLGISAMIIALMGQFWFLAMPSLDIVLTRRFKLAQDPDDRVTLLESVFTARACFTLICFLAVAPVLLLVLPSEWHLGVLAAGPLLFMVANAPTWLLMAQENMPANSRASALQSFVAAALYIALFRPGAATGADVVVLMVATAVSWFYSWRVALGRLWPLPFRFGALARAWSLIWEGRWALLFGLCTNLRVSLEAPLLGLLASLPELGKYRTAVALTTVVGQFIALVPTLLYPRFIEWNARGTHILRRRQLKLAGLTLIGCAGVAAVAFVTAPMFYALLYGPEFREAAYPFAILLSAKFVALSSSILLWGLWAQSQDKRLALAMVPVSVLTLLANVALIPRFGMWGAAWAALGSELLILAAGFALVVGGNRPRVLQGAPLASRALDEELH